MKLKYIASLLATLSLAAAADDEKNGNGNITVAFFPDSQGEACEANDISKALTLTTRSVPVSYTCFNVSDIFTQNRTSGFQNATQNYYDYQNNIVQPNGVAWLLSNLDQYDANANYSLTWYEQRNRTEAKEGGAALWVFYTYAFADCEQIGPKDMEYEDYPWFETSCQTGENGQCRTTPRPIRSFAINRAERYNVGHGGCETWAKLGDAPELGLGGIGKVLLAVAGVVAAGFSAL